MQVGVTLLILLPVSLVALMFCLFLRERDAAYMAILALVVAIIVAGSLPMTHRKQRFVCNQLPQSTK
jgi:uncharacterized membrane protein